jgi:predicted GTPase
MVSVLSRLTPTSPGTEQEDIAERLIALGRLIDHLDGRLAPVRLEPARTLLERAGTRFTLSAAHTVVALAGATGSGKSSLYNALAGLPLSRVSVRRPTTGTVHACVWSIDGAAGLLDWLGVPQRHQVERESELDANEQADLRGLVLLDLPDFDSTEAEHRLEADRLVSMVDLLVWVVDPQKYADRVLHERYLRPLAAHAPVTVVALNQVDRLGAGGTEAVVEDMGRLLAADGLAGVRVVATSARTGDGLSELRDELVTAVASHRAAARRVAADLHGIAVDLAPVAGAPATEEVPRPTIRAVTLALAKAAGIPTAAAAVEQAYRYRAAGATGWPFVRWVRKVRPDPLKRLHLSRPAADSADPSARTAAHRRDDPAGRTAAEDGLPVVQDRTNLPEPTPVQLAQIDRALRSLCASAAAGLPDPWPATVAAAGRSREDDLADALDTAGGAVDLNADRRPVWWTVIGMLQVLLALSAMTGAGWLVLLYALDLIRLPEPPTPAIGVLPLPTVLLLGGLLAGLLLAAASRAVARWAAGRRRRIVERRLNDAVAAVVRSDVLAPIRAELRAYAEVRDALAEVSRVRG